MTDIVIEVEGGMITGIYSDVKDARFVVIDWDLREREPNEIATEQIHQKLRFLPRETRTEYRRALEV